MKICFPVAVDNGINSQLVSHFSSSPLFVIVDSESGVVETIDNCDPQDPPKGCNPFAALQGRNLDAIVVDAIGDAIHQTMNMSGYRVFEATSSNLQQLVEELKKEQLNEMEPFYSQDAGRCGDEEEGSCDHDHEEKEEEEPSDCVLQGGNGCADHSSDSCSTH